MEKEDRLKKITEFDKLHIDCYPATANRDFLISEVLSKFDDLKDQSFSVVGRIMIIRDHGKLTFCDLQDGSGKIQVVFEKEILGFEKYHNLKLFDNGDIIEIKGKVFTTQKGQRSILAEVYTLLTKAILPLPEKWHGIVDDETRYRSRYLDILLNSDLKEVFIKKSIFWNSFRTFLLNNGFLEVETPVLENTPGGADAQPFITHHNALDIDLYLRISMGELWQKRLMVAGFEKTFEIGRQFRNEGIDAEHLQDYTQMEFYWAYANYLDSMKLVEEMYKFVIFKTFATYKFTIKEFDIDFENKWPTIDYCEIFKKEFNIDLLACSENDLTDLCKKNHIEIAKGAGKGRLIDSLWKIIRKKIAGPVFLINHPVEVSPLAKRKKNNIQLVERYQVIIAGSEIGNGYSELNDPVDQASRFKEQAQLRESGDNEAQMHDFDFVEALEHGMPPTTGFGVSERLFGFLLNKPLKECVLFPLMRPKNPFIISKKTVNNFKIKRELSINLLKSHIKNTANYNHALESEAVLKGIAKELNQDTELWGAAGLLHDLDWEETVNDTKKHGLITAQYLEKENYPVELINAIKSHNYEDNGVIEPTKALDFAVRCGEMITGLIYSCALVRPDKKIASVEVKSLKKKMKDKAFATNVRREIIQECEKIGIKLDDFLKIALDSIKSISSEIGI